MSYEMKSMPQASLRVLGAFTLQLDDQLVTGFATDKARALLAYLALEAERSHAREQLAALLWPKIAGESALTNLRKTLHRLRETLDAAVPGVSDILLVSTRQTIQLNAERLAVDCVDFERLLTSCTSHPHPSLHHCDECLARLDQAAELYRGELLAGFGLADAPPFEEWLLLRREALHQRFLGALSTLATIHEARGEYERAHTYATRQLTEDPYREEAHRQVMRLLAQRGLAHQALAQYATSQRLLAAELGVEPEAATTALYEQIRDNKLRIENGELKKASTPNSPFSILHSQLQDWGEMPAVDSFQGREAELDTLERWMVPERCRLVVVLGMGGAGKTALAAQAVRRIADQFDIVIWRSLLNAPPLDELLRGWLEVIARQTAHTLPDGLDDRLRLLLDALRRQRCLLVLDNAESILQAGAQAGAARPGYEDYGQLIQRAGTGDHRSCVLLTSREQPQALARLAGHTTAVRLLVLPGLDAQAGHAILQLHGLAASGQEAAALVAHYSGNPLALQIVANTIVDLFAGSVDAFQQEEAFVFDDIRQVLDEQFARLSDLEREILIWLAIEREAVPAPTLRGDLVQPGPPRLLLEALQGLQKRSLLEKSGDGFTLQNVLLEYTTAVFVSQICQEIAGEGSASYSGAAAQLAALDGLNRHALLKAQAKEYVRQSQVRLILQPIAEQLVARWGKPALIERLRGLLARLRVESPCVPGYAAGNIFNLLVNLQANLRGYDFSMLYVWQAYLGDQTAFDVNFTQADLAGSNFTNPFQGIWSLAYSPDAQFIAGGNLDGTIFMWRAADGQAVGMYQGHTALIDSLAFSPNGRRLASACQDTTVRVWDTHSGQTLYVLRGHTHFVYWVTFSPDGATLASGSDDRTVRLWDAASGQLIRIIKGHGDRVYQVAFSPDGALLASCSDDRTVRIWEVATGRLVQTFEGHTERVYRVTFSPDGATLASGGFDANLIMWDVRTGQLMRTLCDHEDLITAVHFSPDGTILASASWDQTLRLWDARTGDLMRILQGHKERLNSAAISPDGKMLVSSSHDRTIRCWDVRTGQVLQILYGYNSRPRALHFDAAGELWVASASDEQVQIWNAGTGYTQHILHGHTRLIRAIAFSPDGHVLLSGGADQVVRVWDLQSGRLYRNLHGHSARIEAVAADHNGRLFASGDTDQTVLLWNAHTGQSLRALRGHNETIWSLAFSPDDSILASGGETTIYVWHVDTGEVRHVLSGHTEICEHVLFSPDGMLLASASQDATACVWDVASGQLQHRLLGHSGTVAVLGFSPDSRLLTTFSHDGRVCVWDMKQGTLVHMLHGHTGWVRAGTCSPDGRWIASGSMDGAVKLWDLQTGACLKTLHAKGPYAGMNIAGVTGITEAQQVALKALGAVETRIEN
jgi:WD40 repeat protein/DNA-binding SARP family transcriptional activator